MKNIFKIIGLCLLTLSFLTGCKKLIEVDLPINIVTADGVYSNSNTATAVITGIYADIATSMGAAGSLGLSTSIGLGDLADELVPGRPENFPNYSNNLSGNAGYNLWDYGYRNLLYRINSAIEGINTSKTLTSNVKQVLLGELKFTRAWLYFYLVNLYGDVPLVLTSKLETNINISRSSRQLVYQQILADLTEAKATLRDSYVSIDLVSATEERIRPNKYAAVALLARVYLYTEQWSLAEEEATQVINNSNYELLNNLDEVFLKNSREAIWQLKPNSLDPNGVNTEEGKDFLNPGSTPSHSLNPLLYNKFTVEDKRKSAWTLLKSTGIVVPYKYKEGYQTFESKEYIMVFRVAEQYLIRCEARLHLKRLTGENSVASDLNSIRNRAGLVNTSASTQEELFAEINLQRQLELFTEWGHRWLDLKRTKQIDNVMEEVAPLKGGSWAPFKALLPIPYDEFKYNKSLPGSQNPGYTEQP